MRDDKSGFDPSEELLTEELLAGRPEEQVVADLLTQGYTQSLAVEMVARIVETSAFQAACRTRKENRKLSGLLRALGEVFLHSGFEVPRLKISPERFYADFFFANRPIILQGLMQGWSATERWTPADLKSRFGEVNVEVMIGRDDDPDYEYNWENHCAEIKLGEYIDQIVAAGASNNRYLVAHNHVLDLPGMEDLRSDFACPAGFLNPDSSESPYVRFWLGPAGTLTPLHCDDCNILFGQVTGHKQVRLIAPYFYPRLYNTVEYMSEVDLENIDFARFPIMRDVPILEVTLKPGEFLFIPIGWWHWVRSLELSTSLTFTNFYYDDPQVKWSELLE